jgi:CarD family transcriptional regulator
MIRAATINDGLVRSDTAYFARMIELDDDCVAAPGESILTRTFPFTRPLTRGFPVMSSMQRYGFKTGEFIVYPAHGVGQIFGIEEQEIAGTTLELLVINFKKDKMTLRIPTSKVANTGMRKLSDPSKISQAHRTLTQRPQAGRGNWPSIAQEYGSKINSGDLVAIAEVVRDLHQPTVNSEQGYGAYQIYKVALERLSREIAVVHRVTEDEAISEIEDLLIARPQYRNKISASG